MGSCTSSNVKGLPGLIPAIGVKDVQQALDPYLIPDVAAIVTDFFLQCVECESLLCTHINPCRLCNRSYCYLHSCAFTRKKNDCSRCGTRYCCPPTQGDGKIVCNIHQKYSPIIYIPWQIDKGGAHGFELVEQVQKQLHKKHPDGFASVVFDLDWT